MTDEQPAQPLTDAELADIARRAEQARGRDSHQACIDRERLLAELDRLTDYQNEPEGAVNAE